MKLVLNKTRSYRENLKWPDRVIKEFGENSRYLDTEKSRYDPKLIELMEEAKKNHEYALFEYKILEVPEEATDWFVDMNGDCEFAYCVIDGHIYEIVERMGDQQLYRVRKNVDEED